MRKILIEEECDYPENNALYIMLLSGDLVTYGDENRTKQRHVMTHQVYKGVLDNTKSDKKGFYCYNLTNQIKEYKDFLSKENPNNIFFTTTALRDYHYTKQKNNAYYHIEAINLPFQNIYGHQFQNLRNSQFICKFEKFLLVWFFSSISY